MVWQMKSIKYGLEDLAKNNEIVLMDSSCINLVGGRITAKMYDCHDELLMSPDELEKQINFSTRLLRDLNEYPNICTINSVLEEGKRYMEIINGQIKYQEKNLRKRKSGKRILLYDVTNSQGVGKITRKGKRFSYKPIHDSEEVAIGNLRTYAKNIYEINRMFRSRIVGSEDEVLLEAVKSRVKERGLKIDYHHRYQDSGAHNKDYEDSDTDERLVVTAAEFAAKDKYVALLSNDSDLLRILQSCFSKNGLLKVPEKGYVTLLSDFKYYNDGYTMMFSTTMLLEN